MPEIQTAADRNTIRSAMRQTTGMYKDKATLLAETDALPEGEVFGCIDEGYSYEVAAAAATDHDETTAGGDKLYRLYSEAIEFNQVAPAATPITGTPTGTGGNVNGTVYYSTSFVTVDGGETQITVRSASVTATNETVDLTNIPVSSDRRVIARKIYRTPNGVSDVVLGQLLTTINDNTTTTYTDNTLDANLGADGPYSNTTGLTFTNGGTVELSLSSHFTKFGVDTMPSGAGGYASTAIGSLALQNLTSGVRNTAIGHSALNSVTTGNANVAVGVHSGEGLTTGVENVVIGYSTLVTSTSGSYNTAIGNRVLNTATTTQYNTFVGTSAAQLMDSGNNNVGVGYKSLYDGSGANNVAVGYETMISPARSGNFNTVTGYQSGKDLSTGSGNVLIGSTAGENITTGSSNICIGYYSGNHITTEGNNLVLDNQNRATFAATKTNAIVYGVMASTPANQQLHINAVGHLNGGTVLPIKSISGDNTPAITDHTIIVSGQSANVTLTLPAASSYTGKVFKIVNRDATYTVISASSNVVPVSGGAAGTAILAATAGAWCEIQSDGTSWQTVAAG